GEQPEGAPLRRDVNVLMKTADVVDSPDALASGKPGERTSPHAAIAHRLVAARHNREYRHRPASHPHNCQPEKPPSPPVQRLSARLIQCHGRPSRRPGGHSWIMLRHITSAMAIKHPKHKNHQRSPNSPGPPLL